MAGDSSGRSAWQILISAENESRGSLPTSDRPATLHVLGFRWVGAEEEPGWVSLCVRALEGLRELVLSSGYFTFCNPLPNTHQKSGAWAQPPPADIVCQHTARLHTAQTRTLTEGWSQATWVGG